MAKYCSHCGRRINDSALFCKYCGEKADEKTDVATNAPSGKVPEKKPRDSSDDEGLTKTMKIVIAVAAILAVIVVTIGLTMYFGRTNIGATSTEKESNSGQSEDKGNKTKGEAVEYEGHRYLICNDSMSWTEAKEKCEEMGGHLVTINGAGEQRFIADHIEKDGIQKHHYWLGGTDAGKEGEWRWVTGEPFVFTNWDPGDGEDHSPQPNDADNQDYLELQTISNTSSNYMTWNDVCESGDNGVNQGAPWYYMQHYFGYICEWEE